MQIGQKTDFEALQRTWQVPDLDRHPNQLDLIGRGVENALPHRGGHKAPQAVFQEIPSGHYLLLSEQVMETCRALVSQPSRRSVPDPGSRRLNVPSNQK